MKLRLRPHKIELQRILNAKMEGLYKLLYRKRFWTAYYHIRFNFKRQEEAIFKFLKTRLRLHVIKVDSLGDTMSIGGDSLGPTRDIHCCEGILPALQGEIIPTAGDVIRSAGKGSVLQRDLVSTARGHHQPCRRCLVQWREIIITLVAIISTLEAIQY